MNHHCVAALANIAAAQARIDGMKVENLQREQHGEPPAHDAHAFNIEAEHLEAIAREVKEWGWR